MVNKVPQKNRLPWLAKILHDLKNLPLLIKDAEEIFSHFYQNNSWADGESVSGPGSNLANTKGVRDAIPSLLHELQVSVLLDAPCGDFNWMSTIDLPVDRYIGIDIVRNLIERNQARWGGSRYAFVHGNLIECQLPRADAILCRDCLVHLSSRDALRALENFSRSGARWLITTHHVLLKENYYIVTGEWRGVNLTLTPFNLPAPLRIIDEQPAEPIEVALRKSLAVWKLPL